VVKVVEKLVLGSEVAWQATHSDRSVITASFQDYNIQSGPVGISIASHEMREEEALCLEPSGPACKAIFVPFAPSLLLELQDQKMAIY